MNKLLLTLIAAASMLTTKAEFQTTLFATYDNDGEGEFGGAIGLSYYLKSAPLLGFEGVLQRNGFDGEIDEGFKTYGTMVLRYPIGRFTPYLGTGGGLRLNNVPEAPDDNLFGHYVIGVQLSLTKNAFLDARFREEFKRADNNDASFYLGIGWKF